MGAALGDDIQLRGYAESAGTLWLETAQLLLEGAGQTLGSMPRGQTSKRRWVCSTLWITFACGKGMSQTKGLEDYLNRWFQGELSGDVMMPPKVAVAMVLNVMLGKLDAQALGDKPQLDLCVSHDMTVYTVRHGSGLEPIAAAAVEFLDGLLMYREQGQLLLRSHHGGIVEVDEGMLSPQLKACWLWQLPIESSPCHFFQLNPALSRAV